MVTLRNNHKKPQRRFRKFNREKVAQLLEHAPKLFVFQGSARCNFNGEISVLNLGKHLNLGKFGRFTLVALDGTSAMIMHRARHQKNDRFIHVQTNKTVSIGHGMFIKQP